jgi:hypothetical protein
VGSPGAVQGVSPVPGWQLACMQVGLQGQQHTAQPTEVNEVRLCAWCWICFCLRHLCKQAIGHRMPCMQVGLQGQQQTPPTPEYRKVSLDGVLGLDLLLCTSLRPACRWGCRASSTQPRHL